MRFTAAAATRLLWGLHDVADEAAHLLRVADRTGLETLADEDAEAGGLVRAPLADLLELGQRLLELPSVGADDLEDQRVVDLAGEALGDAGARGG